MQLSYFFKRFQKVLSLSLVILLLFVASGFGQWAPQVMAATATWTTGDGKLGTNAINNVAYGNSMWMMLGGLGDYSTSSDGITFTKSPSALGCQGLAATYTDKWVVVCDAGKILTSATGASGSWAPTPSGVLARLLSIAFKENGSNDIYVAVGETGGTIIKSADGISWQNVSVAAAAGFYGVAYGEGKFIAVGESTGSTPVIYTSVDGQVWEIVPDPKPKQVLNSVAYGDGKFVAVGLSGYIYESEDGVTWNERVSNVSKDLWAVNYGAGKFYAAGANETIISSQSGITWETENTPAVGGKTLNGVAVIDGRGLAVGSTGMVKTAVAVTPSPPVSSNATLSNLQITPGSLAYHAATADYTVEVPYGTTTVTVTPTLQDTTAKMTVNGATRSSGQATPVTLDADGSTEITIQVTAQDNVTKKTYTITVNEASPPLIKLDNLAINSPGGLTYQPNTTTYNVTVPHGTHTVKVTPTLPAVAGTIVTVNGTATSGAAVDIALDADRTTEITIQVTAPGHTSNQYKIIVTEEELIKLIDLDIAPGTLNFDPDTMNYTVSVPAGTTSVELTPTVPVIAGANVTANGNARVGGKITVALDSGGSTDIVVDVTAPGYTANQYTIHVTALPLIKLDNLAIDAPGGLTFDQDTKGYAVTVPHNTGKVNVTPTLPGVAGTIVTVNGTATSGGAVEITLDADRTTEITIQVTAPGYTSNSYTITVTEEELIKLTGLNVTPGGLTYDPDTTDYSVNVPYSTATVEVTPTLPPVIGADVKVNGAPLVGGKATVTLDGNGEATIVVDVTAPGYTANQYTIHVTTLPLIKLDNLAIDAPGGLTFDQDTKGYAVTVPHNTGKVNVTPTLPGVAGTIVTVNGTATSGGAVEITLDADRTTEITIQVTAPGHTSNQYTITVTEEELIKLTGLNVTPGGLTYDPDTTDYSVNVPYSTATVEVTPTLPPVIGADVKVNGAPLVGGKATVTLDGNGEATIVVDVTAPGYTANQYTIHVTTLPLIKLDNLAIDAPDGLTFDQDTKGYAVTVPHNTGKVNVTPTLPGVAGTIVTVNGTATSGGAVEITLDADRTTEITIQVTAPGHTSNQYTITVTEEELIKLTGLNVTPGSLTYDPDTTDYSVNVPNGTATVEVTPTLPPVIGADVKVNGAPLVGGKATVTLDGNGEATIVVDVTAPGYTANQYTIHVTTLPLIKLSDLAIDAPGGLTFDQDTKGYAVTVPHNTGKVNVTPTLPGVAGTIVTVNGTATSGGAVEITLDADRTTEITIQVTAPGHTSNQYTITVTEEELIKLTGLNVTPSGLTYDPDTTDYSVNVPNGTATVEVTPTLPPVIGADVKVNGAPLVGGKATVTLDGSGEATIVVDVTAPGYTANQYTIHVTTLPLIKLDNLAIDAPGGLTFDQDTKGYAVTVPHNTGKVNVTPTLPGVAGTIVTVNGTATSGGAVEITLDADRTTEITIQVTAPGHTPNQYTITVTEEELIKLTGLNVTPGGLTFDPNNLTYAVTAPYGTEKVDVTLALPAVTDVAASVNGTSTAGEAVEVALDLDGSTDITVNVTAPGYTANQYTITVTIGLPSTNANLSNLTVNQGLLTPAFALNKDTYTVTVPYSVSTLNVTPTLGHAGATMTVNGVKRDSGNAVPVELNVGPNTITIMVTAQDGLTTKPYTITVTRAAYVPPVDDKVKGTLLGNITKLIGNGNKLSADVYSADGKTLLQGGVDIIGANGKFELKKLEPGSYRMVIYVLGDNGAKLAGETAMLTVNGNKEATASASVIDPFGVVTDAISKKAVDGVTVTVYWADTALNKSQGRTPGSKVELPRLSPMTNKNANGQTTGKDGQFGWLLLPEGDYYIVAEKDGYETYDGRSNVLHVGQSAVKTNITLQPKVLEEGVIEPYITGYPDGTFKPNRGITRAELASILLRVINIKAETSGSIYSDVSPSNWAAPAIAEVTKRGLMVGYPDGTFLPNKEMSRAEIAVVLGKVKDLSGTPQKSSFTDIDKHWAKNAILLAEQAGLLSGHTDGKFRPDNALTRAEAVVIFNKVLGWNDLNVNKPQRWSDVPPNYWAYKDIMRASVPHAYQKLGNGMVIWK